MGDYPLLALYRDIAHNPVLSANACLEQQGETNIRVQAARVAPYTLVTGDKRARAPKMKQPWIGSA